MKPFLIIAALATAAVLPGACAKTIKAPTANGVCWHMNLKPDGEAQFNKVADNVPNIEQCAAALERMRLSFLRMGGNQRELTGAYQGNFIFLKREGIYSARRYDGVQYMMLVRFQGSLVVPSAIPPEAR